MRFEDYGDYLTRRWNELGGPQATAAVSQRTGIVKENQMPWGVDQARAEALAEEFKAVQCPIFVRIVSELHYAEGHPDVGLGAKPGGNHWLTAVGPVASDIIVLKSLDGDGSFQWVDCFSSMGGPESHPQWAVIEPNTDRTWTAPPALEAVPEPSSAEPPAPGVPEPAAKATGSIDRLVDARIAAALAVALKPLLAEIAELKARPTGGGGELPTEAEVVITDCRDNMLCSDENLRDGVNVPAMFNRPGEPGAWERHRIRLEWKR